MAEKLKNCPFCGSDEVESFHHELEGWEETWHVECTATDCGNGTCHHGTEAEAIAAWNTRSGDATELLPLVINCIHIEAARWPEDEAVRTAIRSLLRRINGLGIDAHLEGEA